ncbi:glycine oxidase ThiO [Ureibacillus sinduriensis]|uniref:glycine oxidase n=1 Tax=Ureibacillus sinduriensis BLB-1 = JCM 15800 TaxID=1384057 RepID=A0A0A3HWZ4_9BACL|nr:glycine oxidase ThiO [Ureibacillus sinduriensis]KGR76964.1 glycine oxidase [Ureibacillus sinduriensis BLB-1 = JCM 15800]
MIDKFEVAIIGGGIIGCSIAYYLAKEKMNVAVFEGNQIGMKTTSAAGGMLGAHSECDGDFDAFFPFARSSQFAYSELKEQLNHLCGLDIGYRKGGILKLAFNESDRNELQSILSQPTVKWLDKETLSEMEPHISNKLLGAAYIEEDVNVLPMAVCQAFAKSAQILGATINEYSPVHNIHKKENGFLIETTTGQVEAEYVVVANGVWSTTFFKQLGLDRQLMPVKGECLSVIDEKMTLKHTIFHDHCYIVPRSNGRLVIGATSIENDWNEKVSLDGIETIIAKAKTMLPNIAHLKIDSFWAGLRPQTFDRKPFIGHHPEEEGILFATGHYRNGILLAPATGQMIRDLILKRQVNNEWVEAFKIDRHQPFAIK